MPRVGKTNRVPRTRAGGTWTEAAFFGFLRSGLRRMTMRWPAKRLAKEAARRKYSGPNKRRTWEYQCAKCGGWFADKEVELDHIEPAGKLTCFDDLPGFVERLFCEPGGYQVLCKANCHAKKTKGSRKQTETLFLR